jgi:hypothetical protein
VRCLSASDGGNCQRIALKRIARPKEVKQAKSNDGRRQGIIITTLGIRHGHMPSKPTQSKLSLFLHVISYLVALSATWSSSQYEVFNAVLASTTEDLVREPYRDLVRRSPLGEEANLFGTSNRLSSSLTPLIMSADSANASQWPPVTDLYSQALLTMGDDE